MFRSYCAEAHPAVQDGRHTAEEAFEEFEGTFLYKHKDSANPDWCTWLEFKEYYTDVSATIKSDDYFC